MFGSRKRVRELEDKLRLSERIAKHFGEKIERLEAKNENLAAAKTNLNNQLDEFEREARRLKMEFDEQALELKTRLYRAEGYDWALEGGEITVIDSEGVVLDTVKTRNGVVGDLTVKGVRTQVVKIIERSQA